MVVVVDPLYVTLFVDDARPLATLLVHDAAYFLFGSTEVIEAPSAHSHLRHKMYSHLNGAIIGVLDDIKPSWRTWTRGDPHVAWVYVVGELPQSELSTQGVRTEASEETQNATPDNSSQIVDHIFKSIQTGTIV